MRKPRSKACSVASGYVRIESFLLSRVEDLWIANEHRQAEGGGFDRGDLGHPNGSNYRILKRRLSKRRVASIGEYSTDLKSFQKPEREM